jgi:hypothetical protein
MRCSLPDADHGAVFGPGGCRFKSPPLVFTYTVLPIRSRLFQLSLGRLTPRVGVRGDPLLPATPMAIRRPEQDIGSAKTMVRRASDNAPLQPRPHASPEPPSSAGARHWGVLEASEWI